MPAYAGAVSLTEYRHFETQQFQKDLKALTRPGHARVAQKFRQALYPELRQQPCFGPHIKKLRDSEPPTWRYCIGDWRFFYEVETEEHTVFLIAATQSGSAY